MARANRIKWREDLPSSREWQERTRAKIKVAGLIDRLQKCALGEIEMQAAAVAAAKTLLDRTLPSLTQADINTTAEPAVDYQSLLVRLGQVLGSDRVGEMFGVDNGVKRYVATLMFAGGDGDGDGSG